MPQVRRIPSYRLHKPTKQAVERLNGKDYYLGKHGTDASKEAYHRLVGEWLPRVSIGRQPGASHSEPSVCGPRPFDLQEELVRAGLCRTIISDRVKRIRRVFR